MQSETERLQKHFDDKVMIQNINQMRATYQEQSSGRSQSNKGGAVPALTSFDSRPTDEKMLEFLVLAQRLATAQAQLNAAEGSRVSKQERERRRLINTENGILLNKMLSILNRGKKDGSSKSPFRSKDSDERRQQETAKTNEVTEGRMFSSQQVINETPDFLAAKKQSNATDAQFYETKKPKGSLNLSTRKDQIRRINVENQHILKALKCAKPTFSVANWQQQFQRHVKYRRQIQLLPETSNACPTESYDKSISGFEDIRLNLANKLRGQSQDGPRSHYVQYSIDNRKTSSKFFIHRGIKTTNQPRRSSIGSGPTNLTIDGQTESYAVQDLQPTSFTRTKSVGMRGPLATKIQRHVVQKVVQDHLRMPKTSHGSRPAYTTQQNPQQQAVPELMQHVSFNKSQTSEGRRVKTTDGFRVHHSNNIVLRNQHHTDGVEFDSPVESPMASRITNDQDSLEYWRQQLRSMKGNKNEWRKNAEMQSQYAWPNDVQAPSFSIQKNSFFDYGGLDYDIALTYLPEQKVMTQDLAQYSQYETSVISRVTPQRDHVSSKKRIMMIYSLKNNAKSGERTLKIAKRLERGSLPNREAQQQQQNLIKKITDRRQQLNNTAQLAQLKKMSVDNTTRNLSLYESNEKVVSWKNEIERPFERQQHKREQSDPQKQFSRSQIVHDQVIQSDCRLPEQDNQRANLDTRGGERQGRTTNGQLIAGEFGDDIPIKTVIQQVDFKEIKKAKPMMARKMSKSQKLAGVVEVKKTQVGRKLANTIKTKGDDKQPVSELPRRGEAPKSKFIQVPDKFIKQQPKFTKPINIVQNQPCQISETKDQSTRNYTRSQGSQREKTNMIDRNTKVARNRTNVVSEESHDDEVKSSQTELRINTADKVPSMTLNCDAINLQIETGKLPATDEDENENEILIGDSTVEVANSRDYEIFADKQSYHSAITSGVQAIGPPSMLSGVQNLQVEDQENSEGVEAAESAEYQLDSEDEALLRQEPNKAESDSEVEIVSVDDSYSSDDANLARIKQKDAIKIGGSQQMAAQEHDESDYSQEPFETEENGSISRQ